MKTIHDLVQNMQTYGLLVNEANIKINNKINRCGTREKPKSANGWYRIFDNQDSIGAVFGDFQKSDKQTYSSASRPKKAHYENIIKAMKEAHKINNLERAKQLRAIAQSYENAAVFNGSHPYIHRKKIQKIFTDMGLKHLIKIDKFNNLLIPVLDINSNFAGVQYINPQGVKRFAKGCNVKGNFYNIISPHLNIKGCDLIFVGEGFASLASVYSAMNTDTFLENQNYCCIAALSVQNIEDVLLNLWAKYGDKTVVLVCDNDNFGSTECNIGLNTCMEIKNKYYYRNIRIYVPSVEAIS